MRRRFRHFLCQLRGGCEWGICDHPAWHGRLASPFICVRCRTRDKGKK